MTNLNNNNKKNYSLTSSIGYEWVGWKNDSTDSEPVQIDFHFNTVRNFSLIHIFTNNLFTSDVMVRFCCHLRYQNLNSTNIKFIHCTR